jgi:hypothetical protein
MEITLGNNNITPQTQQQQLYSSFLPQPIYPHTQIPRMYSPHSIEAVMFQNAKLYLSTSAGRATISCSANQYHVLRFASTADK